MNNSLFGIFVTLICFRSFLNFLDKDNQSKGIKELQYSNQAEIIPVVSYLALMGMWVCVL